jgi:hypothetical protein
MTPDNGPPTTGVPLQQQRKLGMYPHRRMACAFFVLLSSGVASLRAQEQPIKVEVHWDRVIRVLKTRPTIGDGEPSPTKEKPCEETSDPCACFVYLYFFLRLPPWPLNRLRPAR